jgi:hypothetical protein
MWVLELGICPWASAANKTDGASRAGNRTTRALSIRPCEAGSKSSSPVDARVLSDLSRVEDRLSESSLIRPSSFAANLIRNGVASPIYKALGQSCGNFLLKLYKSGNTLKSEAIVKAETTVENSPYALNKGGNAFYHHTKTTALLDQLHPEEADREKAQRLAQSEGVYGKIIEYSKNRTDIMAEVGGLWFLALYVAHDPDSSQKYGPHLIEFDFDPNAKVIDAQTPAWGEALSELERKFPGLRSACQTVGVPKNENAFTHRIYFLVAEDSGADLMDYTYNAAPGPHNWYQVFNLDKVIQTKVTP